MSTVPSNVHAWPITDNANLAVLSICKTKNWDHIAAFMHSRNRQLQYNGADMKKRFEHLEKSRGQGVSSWIEIDRIRAVTWHWGLENEVISALGILHNYSEWVSRQQDHDYSEQYPTDMAGPEGEGHPQKAMAYARCYHVGCFRNNMMVIFDRTNVHPENLWAYDTLPEQRRIEIFGKPI